MFNYYTNYISTLFLRKRHFYVLCIILFLYFLVLIPFLAIASEQNPVRVQETHAEEMQAEEMQDAKKVIRIGYQEERAFFNSLGETGQEGYGYEYMEKLLTYTKNEYEPVYISVEWNKGFEMLKAGELDLLPFAFPTEERKQNFLMSDRSLTAARPLLLSLKEENQRVSPDFREVQGKKICIYEHNIYQEEFLEFLNTHHIHANISIIPYKPIVELKRDGEYDYILSTSILLGYKLPYAIALDRRPLYLLANKNNHALMEDMNYALEKLDADDILFERKLFIKYYQYFSRKKEDLTSEELKIIQNRVYKVGVMDLHAPLSFITDKGEVAGIFVDTINKIAKLGQFDVVFEIMPDNPSKEEIEEFDISILTQTKESNRNFPRSNLFGSSPLVLIYGEEENPNEEYIIGTLEQFHLNFNFVASLIDNPLDGYINFHTTFELLDAFYSGKVQDIIVTRHIYNAFFESLADNRIQDLGFSYALPMSFSHAFPKEKIVIINKLLSHIDQTTIDDFAMRNIVLITQHSTFYYIKKYWYILAASVFLLGYIFFVILRRMRKQKEYELSIAKEINPLTGCYTFSKFIKEARAFIDKNMDRDLRIVIVDIDHFAYINETFGFETGSKVLQQLAYHIRATLPDTAPIGNYAGDNFAILSFRHSRTKEELLLRLKLDMFKQSLEPILLQYANISLSIGVYDIIDKKLDVAYMLDCATIAHEKSKAFFGSHIEFYTEEMKQDSIRQNDMLQLVTKALEEKEFELFYQPKFDIEKMHVVGAEALIRLFKDGKMIPPDQFIPILEAHGLISKLDYHVIELACQFISTHKQANLPHISINISGFTIIKSELVDKLIEITKKYNVKPQEIDIEITETALVNNFDMAIKQILALRELGFSISMDDFGTGVSSLNRLNTIPLDTIKLDRVFMIDALENKKSSIIVRTVIDLAKNIGAKTVAEGIETKEQLELLREFSCEQGQGYFYARPMSEKNFLEYLGKS